MSQESSGGVSTVPRIPITKMDAECLSRFIAEINMGCADRRMYVRLVYEDGMEERWDINEWNFGPEFAEWTVIRRGALQKKVVFMEIHGYSRGRFDCKLVEWIGNTEEPVYMPGDVVSFKLRLYISISINK